MENRLEMYISAGMVLNAFSRQALATKHAVCTNVCVYV